MLLALLAVLGLAWWLHKRGELLPDLARWGGVALAGLLAARMLSGGKPLPALALAGAGWLWWRWQARPRAPRDESAALRLLGLAPGADADTIHAAWRARMAIDHPDAGGDTATAQALTAARDLLLQKRG
ncbi:MAG: molecular chaperone DnaJ [Sphingomonadales bacterium]|jgi:hypothetical protein